MRAGFGPVAVRSSALAEDSAEASYAGQYETVLGVQGVAVGRARVARTLEEAGAMQPGEILLTPFTDVRWTPFFSCAAGLATEAGSVLSHGAVAARGLTRLRCIRPVRSTDA